MPSTRKPAPPPPGYITVATVATLLGVSPTTCYRRYPHWYRPSPRRVFAKKAEVLEFLVARRRAAKRHQPYKEFA